MNILKALEEHIQEFNTLHHTHFGIDTIRVEFNKTYTLSKLKELGEWRQLQRNDNILTKIKKESTKIASQRRID